MSRIGPAAPFPASQPIRYGLPEIPRKQAIHIGLADIDFFGRAVAVAPVTGGRTTTEGLNFLAKHRGGP